MKLSRLLSMVMFLLAKRQATARELAETFEISIRTVYRDIEIINEAGIPVITWQGAGGGIRLAEGFYLDRDVLTEDEHFALQLALKSYLAFLPDRHADAMLKKLETSRKKRLTPAGQDSVLVDLAPWQGQNGLKEKIDLLRKAVTRRRTVSFFYPDSKGTSGTCRTEPHLVVFKNWAWYLYAWCLQQQCFLLFDIRRMQELVENPEIFTRRPVDTGKLSWDDTQPGQPGMLWLVLLVAGGREYLAEEWFGAENLFVDEQGRLLAFWRHPDNEDLYSFLLSLGDSVKVLHPGAVREELGRRAEKIVSLYAKPDSLLSGLTGYTGIRHEKGEGPR